MDVKQGYKQTEVGVIPEDWEVLPLSRVVEQLDAGVSVNSLDEDLYDYSNEYAILKTSAIYGGTFFPFESKKIASFDIGRAKLNPRADSIIISRMNTPDLVGECGYVFDDWPFLFLPDRLWMTRFRLGAALNVRWLSYVLSSRSYKLRIKGLATGTSGSMKNIAKDAFLAIPVAFPSFAEQKAIAEALSDADALVESLEQLIAKKRQIKQGAMQELLTGKKRLPGFSGEWQERRLGDYGTTYGGLTGKVKSDFGEGTSSYVTFMNIMSNVVLDCNAFEKVRIKAGESQNRVMKGDLFFNGSSETPEEVGMCSVLTQVVQDVYLNSFCFGFRFRDEVEANGLYLAYYFRSSQGREILKSLAQGATRYNLSKTALLRVSFPMPSIEEQSAIASVLSDMDAEIDALELKLEKARQLKQGMMHNLLTGKIRLVGGKRISEKDDAEKAVKKGHNWQIDEAVLISVLTKNFGSVQYPLGRKRRTKLLYLFHRHMAQEAIGFKKKAAGPYNPEIRYGGPEKIALQRSYVCEKSAGNYQGFVLSENFAEADNYFNQWYDPKELDWLEQFRYSKNDELELLTTVDMAMVDLKKAGAAITLHSVKQVIGDHPEWAPKLQRSIFSDEQITFTIERCKQLFYPDYE